MNIIDPHIHMYSRTTDDYHRMYDAGIRAIVEPSFWLGANRRYAGSFFDYFRHMLEFEPTRSARFGIDYYCCIAMNPKEAIFTELAFEVIAGMEPYLDHPRCVALGEVGYNQINKEEEEVMCRQLELAKKKNMITMIHSPHNTPTVSKKKGIERNIAVVREMGLDPTRLLMDHNTEETVKLTRDAGMWCAMSVYPYSKLTPERVVNVLKEFGTDMMMANSAADWGVADPCSLKRVETAMKDAGFTTAQIEKVLFENPLNFYKQSGRFNPQLDLPFIHPSTYQR